MAAEHDALLDDALEDFSLTASQPSAPAKAQSSAAPPDGLGPSQPQRAGDAGPSNAQEQKPGAAFDPLRKAGLSGAGRKAFDPLKKRSGGKQQAADKGKQAPAAASAVPPASAAASQAHCAASEAPAAASPPAAATAEPGSSGADGAINADLAQGVARLMAELAAADMSGGSGSRGGSGGGAAPNQAALPHEREMASTLAALAAAIPAGARGSGGELPGAALAAHGGDAASLADRLAAQLAGGGGGGNAGGGGEGGEESFAALADTIMQQLLSKDVLYQPMKDIGAKYPQWLAQRRETLPKQELERYEAQYRYIRAICALYEDDPGNFSRLFGLIQDMQACGQPPEEIVQDLAPGLAFGEDGLPQLPTGAGENCVIA